MTIEKQPSEIDREFWIAVRSALLLFVDAIERRYKLGKHSVNTGARIE